MYTQTYQKYRPHYLLLASLLLLASNCTDPRKNNKNRQDQTQQHTTGIPPTPQKANYTTSNYWKDADQQEDNLVPALCEAIQAMLLRKPFQDKILAIKNTKLPELYIFENGFTIEYKVLSLQEAIQRLATVRKDIETTRKEIETAEEELKEASWRKSPADAVKESEEGLAKAKKALASYTPELQIDFNQKELDRRQRDVKWWKDNLEEKQRNLEEKQRNLKQKQRSLAKNKNRGWKLRAKAAVTKAIGVFSVINEKSEEAQAILKSYPNTVAQARAIVAAFDKALKALQAAKTTTAPAQYTQLAQFFKDLEAALDLCNQLEVPAPETKQKN